MPLAHEKSWGLQPDGQRTKDKGSSIFRLIIVQMNVLTEQAQRRTLILAEIHSAKIVPVSCFHLLIHKLDPLIRASMCLKIPEAIMVLLLWKKH